MEQTFLATLRQRFGQRRLRVGSAPDPLALFEPQHPEVGAAAVWAPTTGSSSLGDVISVTIRIGEILADSFSSFDAHLPPAERATRLTNDVVWFLEHLFADRILFWKSVDPAGKHGWRERSTAEQTEPLVLDDRTYRTYVWSGPQGTWRSTPAILARGRIRDEREYAIILCRLNDAGADGFADGFTGAERQLAENLIAEYEKTPGH